MIKNTDRQYLPAMLSRLAMMINIAHVFEICDIHTFFSVTLSNIHEPVAYIVSNTKF